MIDKKHWQAALAVQSAVNLSGVIYSMSRAMSAIWDEANLLGKGTDWVNRHPIAVLFATQVGSLTRTCLYVETPGLYDAAYDAAEAALAEPEPEPEQKEDVACSTP